MEETKISQENSELITPNDVMQEHQMHEGQQLRRLLNERYLTTEEVASKLEVTRQALYLQMKRQYLSTQFKRKLSALGMYPFPAEKSSSIQENSMSASNTERALFQEVKRLQAIIVLQAEHIREMGNLLMPLEQS